MPHRATAWQPLPRHVFGQTETAGETPPFTCIAPLLIYNFLFVPLFRQAAELKAENDLTI